MKRLIPSPWLSAGIFGGWLLLTRSGSAGQILLGLIVALVVPLLMAPLRPTPTPLSGGPLFKLILRVGRDVVLSATNVALGVASAKYRPPNGQFVVVPLELRNKNGLAALAMITAVIPGTVWTELAPDGDALLVHVFNLEDEAAFIADFKADYEQPLKEIFG